MNKMEVLAAGGFLNEFEICESVFLKQIEYAIANKPIGNFPNILEI
jgi:hypothetical protein